MLKRYVSKTQLRVVAEGRAFAFDTATGGGSTYVTADEEEQRMLEHHAEYGHMFALDETLIMQQQQREAMAEAARAELEARRRALEEEKLNAIKEHQEEVKPVDVAEEERPKENVPYVEREITDDGVTIVEVQSIGDARAYMNEKFGIPKSRMLKKSDLIDRAMEQKVKFEGKDF